MSDDVCRKEWGACPVQYSRVGKAPHRCVSPKEHCGPCICACDSWDCRCGQVGALGVPSPEKASDGPATPTDPPCTCTPREGLHHLDCPRFDFGCDCRPTRDGLGVIVCHAHRDSYCQTCGTYLDGEMIGRSRLDPSRCFECADDGP